MLRARAVLALLLWIMFLVVLIFDEVWCLHYCLIKLVRSVFSVYMYNVYNIIMTHHVLYRNEKIKIYYGLYKIITPCFIYLSRVVDPPYNWTFTFYFANFSFLCSLNFPFSVFETALFTYFHCYFHLRMISNTTFKKMLWVFVNLSSETERKKTQVNTAVKSSIRKKGGKMSSPKLK